MRAILTAAFEDRPFGPEKEDGSLGEPYTALYMCVHDYVNNKDFEYSEIFNFGYKPNYDQKKAHEEQLKVIAKRTPQLHHFTEYEVKWMEEV